MGQEDTCVTQNHLPSMPYIAPQNGLTAWNCLCTSTISLLALATFATLTCTLYRSNLTDYKNQFLMNNLKSSIQDYQIATVSEYLKDNSPFYKIISAPILSPSESDLLCSKVNKIKNTLSIECEGDNPRFSIKIDGEKQTNRFAGTMKILFDKFCGKGLDCQIALKDSGEETHIDCDGLGIISDYSFHLASSFVPSNKLFSYPTEHVATCYERLNEKMQNCSNKENSIFKQIAPEFN